MGKKIKQIWYGFTQSGAFKLLIASYLIAIVGGLGWSWWEKVEVEKALVAAVTTTDQSSELLKSKLTTLEIELESLKNEDQRVVNASLAAEIKNIEQVYQEAAQLYEDRADLVVTSGKVNTVDIQIAKFLALLGERKWPEARDQATKVRSEIAKIVAANIPKVASTPATASNTLPGSGYSRQKVSTSRGEFVVSMVVAAGTRVVIETAGDSDCGDNCPTKSLAEHVAASGGFAGINGAYFCPPDYPRCQGKVNSFDTLAVNGRSKSVLNRANNVYSVVPLVVSNGTSLNFYDRTVDWGINTGGGGALANYPRLLREGVVATSDEGGKGLRGFIGTKDGSIVIGHIYSATLGEAGEVLKTLGLQNALNLDGGGSSALWVDGSYKVGPGRSLPTAIVLTR